MDAIRAIAFARFPPAAIRASEYREGGIVEDDTKSIKTRRNIEGRRGGVVCVGERVLFRGESCRSSLRDLGGEGF